MSSPSKLFEEYGANLAQGVVKGIQSEEGNIKSAADSMSNAIDSIASSSFNAQEQAALAGAGGGVSMALDILKPFASPSAGGDPDPTISNLADLAALGAPAVDPNLITGAQAFQNGANFDIFGFYDWFKSNTSGGTVNVINVQSTGTDTEDILNLVPTLNALTG
jgi:hypothetical protein